MVHVVRQSYKQKLDMYMREPKLKLAQMLINCNQVIDEIARRQQKFVVAAPKKSERQKPVAQHAKHATTPGVICWHDATTGKDYRCKHTSFYKRNRCESCPDFETA